MPYEFLDEVAVADVEFHAWGQELAEVFISAADATMNVMIEDLSSIKPEQSCQILLENELLDMLLFDFLQELIYYKDSEQLMLRVPKVAIQKKEDKYHLRAQAIGERLNPERHEQGVDVKAVTLHRFQLKQDNDNWTANVILDI